MPAKIIRTNLDLCGSGSPQTPCSCCWVDMRVCANCERGPLNELDDGCGEPDCIDFVIVRLEQAIQEGERL